MKVRNTFVIFIVSGFWHGANWTFIIWGALNAIYFLPLLLTKKNRSNLDVVAQGKYFPTIKELSLMLLTFGLTVFAWVFFRAENIGHAFSYLSEIFSMSIFDIPRFHGRTQALNTFILILFFLILEWLGRENQFAIANLGIEWKKPFRWAFYYAIIIIIFWFSGQQQQFIYFQF